MVRLGVIGKETVKGLVGIVFWLFLPFFIFTKTISAPFEEGLNWTLLVAYYLPCTIVFLLSALLGTLFWGGNSRKFFLRGLTSISGVVGYMGLPLMVMAFGDSVILPTLMITMADNIVILAGGSLMMEMTAARSAPSEKKKLEVLLSILKGVATNPLIFSVVFAVFYVKVQLSLPETIMIFSNQMTTATGPLALVALGAALATHSESGLAKIEPLFNALFKVVLLPVLVFISCKYIFRLPDDSVKVAVLMAALPIAVNVYILASRYGNYERESSHSMLISAAIGVFTISGLLVYFE
ncbi:auxin efflux carrier [Pseudomonas sp. TCU-HL1]|nr:auxin efflux carrier [Pseudomonas sp. TCU-HL1]